MDVAGLRCIFSSRIRKLREGKMNQGEFADSVGISRGAMSYYEQELRTPDIGVLRAICEKYDVSADYLLGLIPDTNHAVSDVCLETGLYPKVARRLMLIERLKNTEMKPNIIEAVVKEFGEDAQEIFELMPFTSATPMLNLLISSDEGLSLLNLLSAVIFGAELEVGDETVDNPQLRLRTNHKHLQISYPLENITAALWVNIQSDAEKLKEKIDAANSEKPE